MSTPSMNISWVNRYLRMSSLTVSRLNLMDLFRYMVTPSTSWLLNFSGSFGAVSITDGRLGATQQCFKSTWSTVNTLTFFFAICCFSLSERIRFMGSPSFHQCVLQHRCRYHSTLFSFDTRVNTHFSFSLHRVNQINPVNAVV